MAEGLALFLLAVLLLGALVALAERRFRRVREELLRRDDETAALARADSPIVAAVEAARLRQASHGDAHVGQMPSSEAPTLSGHRLLPDGPDALTVRLGLIAAAVDTLDVQTYTWADDLAGRITAAAVLKAARRGVRVRILLDDLHARNTRRLQRLMTAHPGVTLRVYNPSVTRRAYFLNWLFSFRRLNRRMHNKALVADGAAAIVGGRNIGDVYFGLADGMNFRDLDVLTVGASARAIAGSFDAFWRSDFAMPSAAFDVAGRAAPDDASAALAELESAIAARLREHREVARVHGEENPDDSLHRTLPGLSDLLADLVWASASVIDDAPDSPATGAVRLGRKLAETLSDVRATLDIEAGYFVPGTDGLSALGDLVAQGVEVRILTNSFASGDVLATQAAYARYRVPLLRAGVRLFEMRAEAPVRRVGSLLGSSGVAGLHSKVLLADGRISVVGSYNLDPRSALDNTEVMLVIDGEAFAARLGAVLAEGRATDAAYALALEDGRCVWLDGARTLRSEPAMTRPAMLLSTLVRHLPVEWLL